MLTFLKYYADEVHRDATENNDVAERRVLAAMILSGILAGGYCYSADKDVEESLRMAKKIQEMELASGRAPCDGIGVAAIADERIRQITQKGYTAAHDDVHAEGELALAAACYAVHGLSRIVDGKVVQARVCWSATGDEDGFGDAFPFPATQDGRYDSDRRALLVKAGALIAAELDRYQRASERRVREDLPAVRILRSHYNDWLAHPTWWAVLEKPSIGVGDLFYFAFDDGRAHQPARVAAVLAPGTIRLPEQEKFANWWVLEYVLISET
jgi:hypothetical protein